MVQSRVRDARSSFKTFHHAAVVPVRAEGQRLTEQPGDFADQTSAAVLGQISSAQALKKAETQIDDLLAE